MTVVERGNLEKVRFGYCRHIFTQTTPRDDFLASRNDPSPRSDPAPWRSDPAVWLNDPATPGNGPAAPRAPRAMFRQTGNRSTNIGGEENEGGAWRQWERCPPATLRVAMRRDCAGERALPARRVRHPAGLGGASCTRPSARRMHAPSAQGCADVRAGSTRSPSAQIPGSARFQRACGRAASVLAVPGPRPYKPALACPHPPRPPQNSRPSPCARSSSSRADSRGFCAA